MREVLRPPLWLLALIYALLLSFVFALWAAFDTEIALIAWVIATGILLYIAYTSPLEIRVDDELKVGRAHIEVRYIDKVEVLDKEAMALARTRQADPAAFLDIRFWCPTGIKIYLNDPRDRTPYWLISSRRGKEIKAALGKG